MVTKMETKKSFWMISYVNWVPNLTERVTPICVIYHTNFCFQSRAVELIVPGHRASSPGVCRPMPRDRAVARRLNVRPPHGLETLSNKHPVTERNISEERRTHTNSVTRIISLWWQRQPGLDTYFCFVLIWLSWSGDFKIEHDREEDKMHVIYIKKLFIIS